MLPTTELEQSESRRKQFLPELDAAPAWKVDEVVLLACLDSGHWEQHTRSCCGTPVVHRGPTLGKGRCHSSNARGCSALPRPADRSCSPTRKSCRQPYQLHPRAAQSCRRNEPLKSMMSLDRGPLGGSSRDSRRTVRNRRHSVRASGHWAQEDAGHCWPCTPWGTDRSQTNHASWR